MEISLQVEGFTNAAGRPHIGQRNLLDRTSREAGKSWVRGAVVAQLATNTLWLAPRALSPQGGCNGWL